MSGSATLEDVAALCAAILGGAPELLNTTFEVRSSGDVASSDDGSPAAVLRQALGRSQLEQDPVNIPNKQESIKA